MRSVRQLRYDLATALASTGRREEALDQLALALDERGREPPEWRLHHEMAALHEALGAPGTALSSYVHAVTTDPVEGARAAEHAMRIMEEDAALVPDLASAQRLTAAVAAANPAAAQALLLAAQLLRVHDRLEDAAAVLERGVDRRAQSVLVNALVDLLLEKGDVTDARAVLDRHPELAHRSTEARVLLEEERFDAALSVATADGGVPDVEAMALVALGRAEEARERSLARGEPSPATAGPSEGEIVRTVVALALRRYDEARRLVDRLARTTGADAAILRAQVLLEGAGTNEDLSFTEIDEARRSLERIGQLGSDDAGMGPRVLRHRWVRAQRHARAADDRFQYALAEATSALHPDADSVRDAVRACRLITTTAAQDAAWRELVARLERTGNDVEVERAAEALEAAAEAVDRCGATQRALPHARAAVELASTVDRRCTLADISWRASFDDSVETAERIDQLESARNHLRTSADTLPLDAGSRVAGLLGLVSSRLAELADRDRVTTAREAASYLLVAALAEESSFMYLSLAWTLNRAGLNACAYAATQCAMQLDSDDIWTLETNVVMTANHLGERPAVLAAVESWVGAGGVEDPWRDAVLLHAALQAGERNELVPLLGSDVHDAGWSRWDRVLARAILDGLPAAEEALLASVERFREGLEDDDLLIEALALLGELDAADAALDTAIRKKLTAPPDLAALGARLALQRAPTVPAAADQLARRVRSEPSPARLRWTMNVELPLIAQVIPAATPAVQRLVDQCEERIAALAQQAATLAEDLAASGGSTSPDGLLDVLVNALDARVSGALDKVVELVAGLTSAPDRAIAAAAVTAARTAAHNAIADVTERDDRPQSEAKATTATLQRIERLEPYLAVDVVVRARVAAWAGTTDSDVRDKLLSSLSAGEAVVTAHAFGRAAGLAAEREDEQGVHDAVLAGATRDEGGQALAQGLVSTLVSARGCWTAREALESLVPADAGRGSSYAVVRAAADQVLVRLAELLQFAQPDDLPEAPAPIAVDLGEELVQLVDPERDDGVFVARLDSEMRARLRSTTGVTVPGIRLRPQPDLPPDGYTVRIEEVPVSSGRIDPAAHILVRALHRGRTGWDADVTRFHPRSGEYGRWTVRSEEADPLDEREGAAAGEAPAERDGHFVSLSPASHLLWAIERALTTNVTVLVDPDTVTTMLADWREAEPELVATMIHGDDDHLRLTWLVRSLLADGVPVADGPALLRAVRASGGIAQPFPSLRQSVAARLRRRSEVDDDEPLVRVPPHLLDAIGVDDPVRAGSARLVLLGWVDETLGRHGLLTTLVTRDEASRDAVAAMVPSGLAGVRVLTEKDLTPRVAEDRGAVSVLGGGDI